MDGQPLQQELETFEAHRAELLARAEGKFVLIHGTEIAGEWAERGDASAEGYRRYGTDPFLTKKIETAEVPAFMPITVLSRLARGAVV